MKYKVGDKVRVKEDLIIGYDYGNGYYFIDPMEHYKGEIFKITQVRDDCYHLENSIFNYTDAMLEPVEDWGLSLAIVEVSHLNYEMEQSKKTFYFKTYDDVEKGDYVYCDTRNGLMVCIVKEVYTTLEQAFALKDLPNLQLLKECRIELEE